MLLGVTIGYARSTKRIADLTAESIRRSDSDQTIRWLNDKLEKVYSPMLNSRHIIERMQLNVHPRDPEEVAFHTQIASNLYLATGKFQEAWTKFIDTLKSSNIKQEEKKDALEKMVSQAKKDHDQFEGWLGEYFKKRLASMPKDIDDIE